jgi:GNAT superfamily N-acetyltransferase
MTIEVEGPDGNIYEFPDGMPVDQIHAKMRAKFSSKRTKLSPQEENRFQGWYKQQARTAGIDPNPDNPLHKYDYRGAWKAGYKPEINSEDGLYHWPSRFKDPDHPNRFVKGVDTLKEDSNEIDVSKPLPYSVTKGEDKGNALGNIWESVKKGANTPLIPAEKWMRAAQPKESTGPVGEAFAGTGLGIARLAENLSTPTTAAVGGLAGILGSIGLPGFLLTAGFSVKMLKDAYNELMKEAPPGALGREKYANKVTAGLDALMAVMPFTKANKGPLPKGWIKEQTRKLASLPPKTAPDPKAVALPPTVQAPRPAPAVPRSEPLPAEAPIETREPWYETQARELEASRAAERVVAPLPQTSSPLPDIPIWEGNRAPRIGGTLPEQSSPLPEIPMAEGRNVVGRMPRQADPRNPVDPALAEYLRATASEPNSPEVAQLPPEIAEIIGGELVASRKPKGRNQRIVLDDSIYAAIERLGKINPEKEANAGTLTEWKEGLPRGLYRKIFSKGSKNTSDDIVTQLRGEGFQIEDPGELRSIVKNPSSRKSRSYSQEEMADAFRDRSLPTEEESLFSTEPEFKVEPWKPREPGQEGFADIEAKPLGDIMDSWTLRHPKGGNMEVRFGDQGAYVEQVRVPPELQGRGYGSDLYTHLGEMMKKRGIPGSKIDANVQGDPVIMGKLRAKAAAVAGEGKPGVDRYDVSGEEDPNDFLRSMLGEEGFADVPQTRDQMLKAFRRDTEYGKRRTERHIQSNLRKAMGSDALELRRQDPKQNQNQYVIIHKSTNEPDKWQASQFDEQGPWGHQVYDSQEQALRTYSGDWVKGIGAPFGSTGEWSVKRVKKAGQEGFADTKKDQGALPFTPVSIPGQKPEQSIGELYSQILQAPDAAISKRDLLGLKKKKKVSTDTPLFDDILGEKKLF